IVQFTKLKDGVAIGCAFNHAILDWHSTWHFMSSWVELSPELSRGGGGGGGGGCCPSVVPILDHALAAHRSPSPSLLPVAPESLDPNSPAKPLIHRLFSFPQTLVDQIKLATNQNPNPNPEGPDSEPEPEREPETKTKPKPFSTFQSLGAHMWRAVARARGLAADELTVFAVFADCRGRVDPPVSPAYIGN
ncbi:BAHD acyltransferase DCR-like, partial [Ananas comosus]|uniref:BAHD acyltransferase DCR-like n=1 Tax=Ananas comosus TaxID=4615 RepID=A0A6P5EHA5_ANACO